MRYLLSIVLPVIMAIISLSIGHAQFTWRNGVQVCEAPQPQPGEPRPPSPADISYYRGVYDDNLVTSWEGSTGQQKLDGYATGGDAQSLYYFQYALEGTLSLHEAVAATSATPDDTYILKALVWSEQMMTASELRSDGYFSWNTGPDIWGVGSTGSHLNEIQGATGMARCAMIILEDSRLNGLYGTRAVAVYEWLRDNIIDKWQISRSQDSWCRNTASNPATIWNDKVSLTASIMCRLRRCKAAIGEAVLDTVSDPNQGVDYDDFLDLIATKFKLRLKDANADSACYCYNSGVTGTLIWDCGLNSYLTIGGDNADDTSHANRIPVMAIDLYEAGYNSATRIELTDLQGLAKLLTEVIWDGTSYTAGVEGPYFYNFIDGDDETWNSGATHAGGMGIVYHGWVRLADYDATAFAVMGDTLKAILDAGVTSNSLEAQKNWHSHAAMPGHLAKALTLQP